MPDTTSTGEGNVKLDPTLYPGQRIQGEPNDSFANALDIILDTDGHGYLQGDISSTSDVDVYRFESLAPGDRIIIDVAALDQQLDAMLTLFDDQARLAFENDDRSVELQQLDPYLNAVIRRDSSVYYLAIARAPLALANQFGRYEVLVTVVSGGQVPMPTGQTVVLDFDGGTITIPSVGTYSVDAFDAADIATVYAGKTQAIRNQIADTVATCYEGLAFDLLVVPGDSLPPTGTSSTVLFGGQHPQAYGISQAIDSYNADPDDESIVFTEMFTPSRFGRTLTATELGTAIGNVAAHEVGHLLGLNHVANEYDLMDTTGGSLSLLLNQQFLESPLDESIFPFGLQDGWLLLLETLGLEP